MLVFVWLQSQVLNKPLSYYLDRGILSVPCFGLFVELLHEVLHILSDARVVSNTCVVFA